MSAYKALGYKAVGEAEPSPTAHPCAERDQVVAETSAEKKDKSELKETPEQVVTDEMKKTEYACPFCGRRYSRKGKPRLSMFYFATLLILSTRR